MTGINPGFVDGQVLTGPELNAAFAQTAADATVTNIGVKLSADEATLTSTASAVSALQTQATSTAATLTAQATTNASVAAQLAALAQRVTNLETATPPPTPPNQPTALHATTVNTTSVVLAWTAPVGGTTVSTYRVDYKLTSATNFTAGPTVSAPTVTATVSSLTAATSYDFHVFAISSAGAASTPSTTFTQVTASGTLAESANGASVSSTTGNIVDGAHNVYTLVASTGGARTPFQIVTNGVLQTITQGVVKIEYYKPGGTTQFGIPNGSVIQQTDQGWYYAASIDGTNTVSWTQIPSDPFVTAPPPTTNFSVANARIISPTGSDFVIRGINVVDGSITSVSPQTVKSKFPNCNFIRLAVGNGGQGFVDGQPPGTVIAWVNAATALGMVVEVESHIQQGGTNALTGSDLSAELQILDVYCQAAIGNPLFWLGSENEVIGGVSANHLAWYNRIRVTNNCQNIFVMCMVAGNPYNQGGTPDNMSVYTGMTNVIWDQHWYNWITGGDTNLTNVQNLLTSDIRGIQAQGNSADGVIPVALLETGFIDYAGNYNVDAGGGDGTNQIIQSAYTTGKTSGSGAACWLYNGAPYGWAPVTDLVSASSGNLTSHGTFLSQFL